MRHILVIGDDCERELARAYVERMLATADPDGYLGIHQPDLRYPPAGENGELWAQSSLGRVLLGYLEATSDRRHAASVLAALEGVAQRTMAAWPIGASEPFQAGGYAGVAHGLTITDLFDRLADLTGDAAYRDYGAWLYRAFSAAQVSEADIQLPRLLDPESAFVGHGVHTYEHLRSLILACRVDSDPVLREALDAYVDRLRECLTPAGGPIGDEWIRGRRADATATGYEFCSTQELLDSVLALMVATGDLAWGDVAEWVLYNAGLGAWHPEQEAIAYLQTDNSYAMAGNRPDAHPDAHQTRYRYSPLHREAAVCCVPNAGRLLPTYLRGAVLLGRSRTGRDEVVVALYGPIRTELVVAGTRVSIKQVTDYPWFCGSGCLRVRLLVSASAPTEFDLVLRIPAWASGMSIDGVPVAGTEPGGDQQKAQVRVSRVWSHDSQCELEFAAVPRFRRDRIGEGYVTLGPLVLALPIPAQTTITRTYEVPGLADLAIVPTDAEFASLALATDRPDLLAIRDGGVDVPLRHWVNPGSPGPGDPIERTRLFVPLARTTLRRVTFPLALPSTPP